MDSRQSLHALPENQLRNQEAATRKPANLGKIAAQQSRAQSPDSVSNWDSSEPEDTSGEDLSIRSSKSQKDKRHKSIPTTTNAKKPAEKAGTSSRKTPVKKTGSNVQKGVNSFVGRDIGDSPERARSPATSNKYQDEIPPYNFTGALRDEDSKQDSPAGSRPGKSRKGMTYDHHGVSPNEWTISEKTEPTWPSKRPERKQHQAGKIATSSSQQQLVANSGDFGFETVDLSTPMSEDPGGGEPGEDMKSEMSIADETKDARYVYYFQQGSTHYFDVGSRHDEVHMSSIADTSEKHVRRCISEVFSALRIVVDFLVILFLELVRFVLFRIIGAFLVGVILIFGDSLLKPFLATCFNSVCQPVAAFGYNCSVACRTISIPIRDTLTALCNPCVMLLRAFRLFEVNWNSSRRSPHVV